MRDWETEQKQKAAQGRADRVNEVYTDVIGMLSEAGDHAGAAMVRALRTQWRRSVAKDGVTFD